jgi:flagellar biosynthetic protein FliQ
VTPEEAISIGQTAIYVLLQAALPLLLIGLFVGLLIAFFQALTQIQEITLTFVPKIVVIFISAAFLLPYMLERLTFLMNILADRIIGFGTPLL